MDLAADEFRVDKQSRCRYDGIGSFYGKDEFMKLRTIFTIAGVLLMAGIGLATNSAACKPAPATIVPAVIQLRSVAIDRAKGELRFPINVSRPDYMLEFLLCGGTGKGYESAFSTTAKGQDIHAGLLLLGLHRGIPPRRIDGKEIPPQGPGLELLLEWTGKDKTVHRMNVLELLTIKGGTAPKHWVFVGSEIARRGGYSADGEGGLISVSNLPSAVIDLPVLSSRGIFGLKTKKIPKDATSMRMVIRPLKKAAQCPYARATLDVFANGALAIDGKSITMAKLEEWAIQFTNRFPKAMVEIRTSAKALACLPLLAELELKLGGVFDAEKIILPPAGPILPRTKPEVGSQLAQFKAKFAAPEDEVHPPAEQARVEIDEIDRQLKELERVKTLWAGYRKALDTMGKSAPAPKQPEAGK
jgi:hypothetical protein